MPEHDDFCKPIILNYHECLSNNIDSTLCDMIMMSYKICIKTTNVIKSNSRS